MFFMKNTKQNKKRWCTSFDAGTTLYVINLSDDKDVFTISESVNIHGVFDWF